MEIGRWFLLTTVLVVGVELNYGLLLGKHDFLAYNVLRLAQPALMAASFADAVATRRAHGDHAR